MYHVFKRSAYMPGGRCLGLCVDMCAANQARLSRVPRSSSAKKPSEFPVNSKGLPRPSEIFFGSMGFPSSFVEGIHLRQERYRYLWWELDLW